jgi:DNA-binding response OmpR family regulator
MADDLNVSRGRDEVLLMPTALIVEDEPEANRLLSMLVQLRGYRTESAFTGGEALSKVDQRPPDIVFLDLMLPDINGYEVCTCLKTQRATSLIPVVMVTARVAEENRIESFSIGADDYIPKPYTPDQIFKALTNASSWSGSTCNPTIAGVIPIEPARVEESLRLVGQLGNLLVARTTLELEAIRAITKALKVIRHDALDWARQSHQGLDTALGFLIEPDRLAITLRDSSGWLADTGREPADRWRTALSEAHFDEVRIEEPGQRMTFYKRYPPCESPSPT